MTAKVLKFPERPQNPIALELFANCWSHQCGKGGMFRKFWILKGEECAICGQRSPETKE